MILIREIQAVNIMGVITDMQKLATLFAYHPSFRKYMCHMIKNSLYKSIEESFHGNCIVLTCLVMSHHFMKVYGHDWQRFWENDPTFESYKHCSLWLGLDERL